MNEIRLTSKAEVLAEEAENLKSFSGLKLLHVKTQLALILAQIGRGEIFDEYTKHDISHIDYMLDSLEVIIPEETQNIMTPADWLMITLAIYFHDLGMLVTKHEFKERGKSTFPLFKKSILDGNFGMDYRDKIFNLEGAENQDRFIYQELVRRTHAERIKYWILDEVNSNFPCELSINSEIKKLISPIDSMFKRDLAMICESHHLSDLDDYSKYKHNQQYGTSIKEVVNLHYAALILRTADLLHITSDRTPSIEFNLINPTDPISQEEWAKQRAVKAIRPQDKTNKEGHVDPNIPKDTFEVIAYFENEKGFFGLISYLKYADQQLKDSFRFNEIARKQFNMNYKFPWRNIDDSNIETKDFEKHQFEFVLDQTKILDLLVGHTLYNEPTVVLRELTQNSIDATRLMKYELEVAGKLNEFIPEIKVIWDEDERALSFIDNGTGMTLDIIQNHLLKVGSSRYQDENFKKKHPNFSPISRFGIGLLTCFLVADDLDIITKSSEIEKAILLKIKKVHGKYLLKYLGSDKIPSQIKDHGTIIKLFVRSDVNLSAIEKELKKWILIPNCNLTLIKNNKEIKIGYNSPSDVLTTYLQDIGYNIDNKNIKVREVSRQGVTMAYALRYIEHWKEWVFLAHRETEQNRSINTPIGTCIEGIRVDFNSPGFKGTNIIALANSSGKNAPKTNVARSNIEITPEREALLHSIYEIYLEHFTTELNNLLKAGFSISWAASEANFMINAFLNYKQLSRRDAKLEDSISLKKAVKNIKCILIEKDQKREVISLNELQSLQHFWIVESRSYSSADSLIREVKSTNSSALALLKAIFLEDSRVEHIDNLLCNIRWGSYISDLISYNFQVDSIKIVPEQRRLDLRWIINHTNIWVEIQMDDEIRRNHTIKSYVQLKEIDLDKSINQIAVHAFDCLFILKGSELNTYLVNLIAKFPNNSLEDKAVLSKIMSFVNIFFTYKKFNEKDIEEILDAGISKGTDRNIAKFLWEKIDKQEFIDVIKKTDFTLYDTSIWNRRELF